MCFIVLIEGLRILNFLILNCILTSLARQMSLTKTSTWFAIYKSEFPDSVQFYYLTRDNFNRGHKAANYCQPCNYHVLTSLFNYESNQQDAIIQVNLLFPVSSACFGRCFRPSSGAFDYLQYLVVFTQVATGRCAGWVEITKQWILPDTVYTVKWSWWWAKTSPETCRTD
jgi:hypothetical protein